MEIESLIKTIIQCAYNVRTHLAAGFLESVYQKALMIELKEKRYSCRYRNAYKCILQK